MKLCSDEKAAQYIADREGRPCSARTVRAYRKREEQPLPARWSGRTWIYTSDEINTWLEGEQRRRMSPSATV